MLDFLARNIEAISVGVIAALVTIVFVKIMSGTKNFWLSAIGVLKSDFQKLKDCSDIQDPRAESAMKAIMAMQIRFGVGTIFLSVCAITLYVSGEKYIWLSLFFSTMFAASAMIFLSYNSLYFDRTMDHLSRDDGAFGHEDASDDS